ncbi:MAG: polysaccharide biosynthesis tyrosine autokinase [Pseudomonas sp.]|nr:polysaccharide biosynthesis tyrosine autokinase [Pseudomonas sp.]
MQQVLASSTQSVDANEIDIFSLIGTLIDHKWLIGAMTGICMLAGVTYAVLARPVYQVNALVQVEPKKNDLLGFSDVGSMLGQESPAATEIELLNSRSIIGKAVDNLKLYIQVEPMRFPVVGDFLARRFESASPGKVASPLFGLSRYGWGGESVSIGRLEVPETLLGTPLTLVAGPEGHFSLFNDDQLLIEGSVGQHYEQQGVTLQIDSLKALPGTRFGVTRQARMTSILAYQDALDINERGKESGIISLVLESVEPRQAIKILNEVTQLYVRQNVDRTSAEAAQSLQFLKEQLPQVRHDLEKAENALNQYQMRTKSIDISLETKAILDQIVALDTSISELKLRQAEMDRRFTPEHPAYRALLVQLSELTSKQQALGKKVEGLPETQQELLSLTRDVEVGTAIYTQLLNKSQELDVMRAGTVGNVRLIDSADVDVSKPVKPKKPLIVLLAIFVGAFLGVALVLLRRAMNRGLESPELIEQLGIPVYASIPYSQLQRSEDEAPAKYKKVGKMSLLAVNHPTDLAVEAIRSLRTSLHFAMLEADNNRLMISGPSPEVGKTFVSVNLATVVAQTGQRVLLVDVDMRKGYLHKALGLKAEQGLSDVLVNRTSLSDSIRKTSVEHLDFISRGQIPPNPSELLMHGNFTAFLEEVSARYDLVILDTPPFLAVTDAAIVGRQSGTNLVVARYGVNTIREVELTLRRFEQNSIALKGMIFNGVERRLSTHYGYGYYHYEYKSEPA